MTRREDELKYGLAGPEDHRRLMAPGGIGTETAVERLVNHYLDTADLQLSAAGAMLRLRIDPSGAGLLTLKRGAEAEPGFFRSSETEAELPPQAAARVLAAPEEVYRLDAPPVKELRQLFGEPPLRVIGTLATERRTLQGGGFRLELDRITFPDGSEEHELEVETDRPAAARAWLEAEFRRLGVRASPSRLTKLARLVGWLSTHIT